MDEVGFDQIEAVLEDRQEKTKLPNNDLPDLDGSDKRCSRKLKSSSSLDDDGERNNAISPDSSKQREASGNSHRDLKNASEPSSIPIDYEYRSRHRKSSEPKYSSSARYSSHRQSGSIDKTRDRRRRKKSLSNSIDYRRKRNRAHSKSRSVSTSLSRIEKKKRDENEKIRATQKKEEERIKREDEKRLKEEEEKRRREVDEARRDDLTVLALNLSLKATERDIWKFFSEKAGKVRDIQLIRDSRSGKSKGVCYVEFFESSAVLRAMALSGSLLLGVAIVVQASQAEKNRAAKAAKQQAAEITEGGPMKIYVGGLVDSLNAVTETDLRNLFSPFGEIVSVDVHKDPYTGRCKGYAFLQFRYASDAREAMTAMNGFEIGGRQIRVGYATDPGQKPLTPLAPADSIHGVPLGNNLAVAQSALQTALMFAESQTDNERLDDEGGGLLSGVNPRISLMQKLQRLDSSSNPSSGMPDALNNSISTSVSTMNYTAIQLPAMQGSNTVISCNIQLEPLYSEEEIQQEGEELLNDIVEDVKLECSKYGAVIQIWLDRKNIDGRVFVKFGNSDQAIKAHQALNGRFFAGNRIRVSFISETAWILNQSQ